MSLLDTASLIVTPNGYKEGKLYSVIPSDGSGDMSVVRATTATRVNSSGLIELVPYNLVGYSEQFDNAYWGVDNATITANSTTAPNGTLTADTFTRTASTGYIYKGSFALEVGQYTQSVYAKANASSSIRLEFVTGSFARGAACIFDLSNGTAGTITIYGGVSGFTATIENVGNGWYRCSLGGTITIADTYFYELSITSGSVFAWGAQLVEGSTAKDYQKTETRLNIPRLDYSNGTCPSLLVEPQRTNLALYSEQFDNAAWTKYIGSVTANATTSPSGIQNADKFIDSTDNDVHSLYKGYTISGDTTFSIYVKAAEYSKIAFTNLSDGGTAKFDVSNGTIISTDANWKNSTIENLDNGWYRIASTTNGISGAKALGTSLLNSSNQEVFAGTGTSGIYLWGAQVELGSYPTSYIPTTSASVTRNADAISKTGISSLIGQTEGTLFVEVDYQTLSGLNMFLSIRPNSNKIEIYRDGGDIYGEITGSTNFSFLAAKPIGTHKIAFAYKSGSSALYIDGALIGQNTTAFTFSSTMSDLFVNQRSGGLFIEAADYKAVALWKTRLTNAELATLTTI